VSNVIRRCLEGKTLDMVSPSTARDFIHVDDVVEAYLQIGQLSLQCGETFNIGTGVQSTVREVVNAALKATGARPRVNWGSMPARSWDSETWLADITRVRRTLKWSPKIGLAEGILKTADWFRARLREPADLDELATLAGRSR
jgi:nucleoside-diphosphate-sugar epimerase